MTARIVVRGKSIGQELVWANTLLAREFSNVTPGAAVDALLALPEKAWSRRNTDAGLDNLSLRFDGVTCWQALAKIAETSNIHVREVYGERRVDLGAFGTASGVSLDNPGAIGPDIDLNTLVGLIESVSIVDEGKAIVNKIVAVGNGEGNNVFTMRYSDRSVAGGFAYDVRSALGPDGKLYYYLQDDDSVARYGRREAVIAFKDIGPLANSVVAFTNAANALYDLASTYLQRFRYPQTLYSFGVAKLANVFQVGETIHVDYRGVVDDGSPTNSHLTTLRPAANGTYEQWNESQAGDDWQHVDEAVADADTTYIQNNQATLPNAIDSFRLPGTGIEGASTIDSVKVYFRGRRLAAGAVTIASFLRLQGTDVAGTQQAMTGSFADYSEQWTTNPLTGKPWQPREVEALEIGVKTGATVADSARVTQVWLEIAWTSGGRRTWRHVDEDLVVMEKKRQFNSDGHEKWDLLLSTVGRYRETSEEIVVGAIETLQAFKTAVKPYTYEIPHGSKRESIQFSGSFWADYRIRYRANVRAVLRVGLDVIKRPLKSNTTGAASGGGSTSGAGGGQTSSSAGSHSHSVTADTSTSELVAHNHEIVNLPSGTSIPFNGNHTHQSGGFSNNESSSLHSHDVSGQTAQAGGSHSHTVNDHTHAVSAHTHALTYGIFESSIPSTPAMEVWINGVNETVALGGPWNSDILDLDITQYLQDGSGRPLWQANTIQIRKGNSSPDGMDVDIQAVSMLVATALGPV